MGTDGLPESYAACRVRTRRTRRQDVATRPKPMAIPHRRTVQVVLTEAWWQARAAESGTDPAHLPRSPLAFPVLLSYNVL
jgi:hypothetical protein